jgi:hypothetical protein
MRGFNIEDLTEALRDASNDSNTLRHIAEEFGLSSNHPHFIMENIRKLKLRANDRDAALSDLESARRVLADIKNVLGVQDAGIDVVSVIKSLKSEPKNSKGMTELYSVIDTLMKENLNLKIENSKLEFEILVHKKNQGK